MKVKASALCGTDMHIYDWNFWARKNNINIPMIASHEAAGEIAAIGKGVIGFAIGDRVAGETHIACGNCLQCQIANNIFPPT